MTDTLAALLVELRSLRDVRAIGLADRIEAEVDGDGPAPTLILLRQRTAQLALDRAAIRKVAEKATARTLRSIGETDADEPLYGWAYSRATLAADLFRIADGGCCGG